MQLIAFGMMAREIQTRTRNGTCHRARSHSAGTWRDRHTLVARFAII